MFFQKITYMHRKIIQKVNEILKPYQLNTSDWRVFMYLSIYQNSNLSSISDFYNMDKAILSRNVSKLEKLGFLEFLSSNDKREKLITLSSKGKEIFFDINILIRKYEKTILSTICKDDEEKLFKLIDIINDSLTENFINLGEWYGS